MWYIIISFNTGAQKYFSQFLCETLKYYDFWFLNGINVYYNITQWSQTLYLCIPYAIYDLGGWW